MKGFIWNRWLFVWLSYLPIACWIFIYALIVLMPTATWFEYHSVVPSKRAFLVGSSPEFISTSVIHREVNFSWKDTLYCDFGEGFVNYSHYPTSRDSVEPRETRAVRWFYQGVVPNIEATCYLDTTIIHTEWFDIEKKQHIVGTTFDFSYEAN